MRARNIKPALFKNELLATSDPLHTLIFQGLWCMADREGRLEDRPRQIHLAINPGRAFEGTEASLAWLEANNFVIRYAHKKALYIQVVNFSKHQNPHVKEAASTIPAPCKHGASTIPAPCKHGASTMPARLIPSSLIPDSPSLNITPPKNPSKARRIPSDFALSDEMRSYALKRLPDCNPDLMFEQFKAYHEGKGTTCVKWERTWITWVVNAVNGFKYAKKGKDEGWL